MFKVSIVMPLKSVCIVTFVQDEHEVTYNWEKVAETSVQVSIVLPMVENSAGKIIIKPVQPSKLTIIYQLMCFIVKQK